MKWITKGTGIRRWDECRFKCFYYALAKAVYYAQGYAHYYLLKRPEENRWILAIVPIGRIFEEKHDAIFHVRGPDPSDLSEDEKITRRRVLAEVRKAKAKFIKPIYKLLAGAKNINVAQLTDGESWPEIYEIWRDLLCMAVRKDDPKAIRVLCGVPKTPICVTVPKALRLALRCGHIQSLGAILQAAPWVTSPKLYFETECRASQRQFIQLMLKIIAMIKDAKLNENLPVFDHLVEMAEKAPAIRAAFRGLIVPYPATFAKVL